MESDFDSNNETICLSGEFRCNDLCIEDVLRCDTKSDCSNGQDELNCGKLTINQPFFYQAAFSVDLQSNLEYFLV